MMNTNEIEDARTWLVKKTRRAEKDYDKAMERGDYKATKNLLKELEVLDTLMKVIERETTDCHIKAVNRLLAPTEPREIQP